VVAIDNQKQVIHGFQRAHVWTSSMTFSSDFKVKCVVDD